MPVVANAAALLAPFASFLPAEHLGASGVLAVVTMAMYMGRKISRVVGPVARVQIRATWDVVTYILESLVFILVGLQLPYVLEASTGFRSPSFCAKRLP
jgi:CPA1 family monovalent cation:H+ antiporter